MGSIKLLQIDYADFSNGNIIDSAIHGDKIRNNRSIQKISCDVIEHRIMQSIPDRSMQKLIFMRTASKHTFVDIVVEVIFCLSSSFNVVISQLHLVQISDLMYGYKLFETPGMQYQKVFITAW